MTPEAKIVRKIHDYLTRQRRDGVPCWWIKTHGSAYQKRGVPDILLCWRGRFVGIEVKQSGQSPTRIQAHTMRMIREAGGLAFVARSVDDVQREINQGSKWDAL